jgi:MFS family permease
MPALILTAFFITIAHLGGGAQWTLSTYGVQLRSPDHVRGRILAGDFALVTLTLSVTSALAGIASELLGVRQAISVFAIAAALASVTYIKAIQRLRNLPQPQINAEP